MATLLDFNQYDPETALLIAQLQLEDTLEISKGRKGKGREDQTLSDEELAFRLASEEFVSMKQMYEDYSLAKSLNEAVGQDAAMLEAHRVMEEAAAADRRAAELLSHGQPLPQPTEAQRLLEDRTFKVDPPAKSGKQTPRAIAEDHPASGLGEEEPLDSIWRFDDLSESLLQRAGPSVDRYRRVDCVSCDAKIRIGDAVLTTCQHYWCSACIKSVVEVYLRDESLHPLRCCKNPFEPQDVSNHLRNKRLYDQFDAKRREYEVPAQNRVYCATPTCSAFLGSSEACPVGDPNIRCTHCRAQTCATCRKPSHPGDTCRENEAVDQLRALAREVGWQTCPGCLTVVDLHHGCNHMTCHCRTEFCFVCGERWKNCPCPQWDEQRLVAVAQMRAQNDLGAVVRAAEPVRFREAVNHMAQNLRTNHECNPHHWRNTGPGNCEECGDYLPLFLKMCRYCNLFVCRRCSLNRL